MSKEKKELNLNEHYAIDKEVYDWCLKNFGRVEENFGLNLNVHIEDSTLEDGQIFLFNHPYKVSRKRSD